jgi:hypothetical protein
MGFCVPGAIVASTRLINSYCIDNGRPAGRQSEEGQQPMNATNNI